MKLSVVVCVLIIWTGSAFSVERTIVGEYFSNISPAMALPDSGMDSISVLYDTSLAIIRYHVWWPNQQDPYYQYNPTEITTRNNYLDNQYTPHLFLDGTVDADGQTGGFNIREWSGHINNEIPISSPLEIDLGGFYDTDSRTGTLNVTIVARDSIPQSNLRLRIALTESDIAYGNRVYDQVFRDMLPSTDGYSITLHQGDSISYSQDFSCPEPINDTNCELVAFVQSDTGRRILQGAKIDVMSIVYFMNAFDLISPENNDTIFNLNPLFIWHASSDPDSGYAINYRILASSSLQFLDTLLLSDPVPDTFWAPALDLNNHSEYYWKVLASNGHAPDKECIASYRFATEMCHYHAGDANGNGQTNGIDVSYMVNYLKGDGPMPPDYCICDSHGNLRGGADANGNCEFNGIDVSYLVNFLKGIGQAPQICPDCPPQ